jgi:DNA replication and repair protein RecF
VFIKQIHLKKFRCFPEKKLFFTNKIVVIEGPNGVGKTSLLEALHYGCYLRSFRTHAPRELLQFDEHNFLIKILFEHAELDLLTDTSLQISFFEKKRLVKLNDKALHSYKELMEHYRIITITEDDLELVKLGPDVRRQFIDQAILLYNPMYIAHLKEYKAILENRNKLLQQTHIQRDLYDIWTEQLRQKSQVLQKERIAFLTSLQFEVHTLLAKHIPGTDILFTYESKKSLEESYASFTTQHASLYEQERRFGRSLFGAHLDEIRITFQGSASRTFASRGQQKLIVLLIKIAQTKALKHAKGSAILLLDDFITDFDGKNAQLILNMLTELDNQLIFTVPVQSSVFTQKLLEMGAQHIVLDSAQVTS